MRAAAAECFAESGFQAATTAEIARRAGVAEGTVFGHYTNKLGLLTAVTREFYDDLQRRGEQIADDTGATPAERLRRLVNDWCAVMARQWDLVQVYIHTAQAFGGTELAEVVIAANRRYTRLYTAVIDELRQAGDLSTDLSANLVRDMIFGTLEHTARGQRYAGRSVDTIETGRQILDLLLGSGGGTGGRLAAIEAKIDILLEERSNAVDTVNE